MKKFIKGTYLVKDEIEELNDFARKNEIFFRELVDFANNDNLEFNIGYSADNEILCEYIVKKRTLQECRAVISEFKKKLKKVFKKIESLYEGNGDSLR